MVDVTDALIQALVRRGVKTVYVPGDFVLGLFKRFEDCKEIETVCTAGEEGAAFAADAEARLNGLGVVMITYGVGALKVCVFCNNYALPRSYNCVLMFATISDP